jgi:hypothetical protein
VVQPILIIPAIDFAPAAAGCPSQIEPRTTLNTRKLLFHFAFFAVFAVLFAGLLG